MKKLVDGKLGADGTYALAVEEGNLTAKVGYPVMKILEPIKKNFVDKIKALIPGDWDDKLIDEAWESAVNSLSEAPKA